MDPELPQQEYQQHHEEWMYETFARWRRRLRAVFGAHIPKEQSWTEAPEIARIIHMLTGPTLGDQIDERGEFAYLKLATSGDTAIQGAELTADENLIALYSDREHGRRYVFSPMKMTFVAPLGSNRHAYLWIELDELDPLDVGPASANRQDLVELADGSLIGVDEWYSLLNSDSDHPEIRFDITRLLHGPLLILCKANSYHLWPGKGADMDPAGGFHSDLGKSGFHMLMKNIAKADIES